MQRATSPRLRNITNLPHTQKFKQKFRQNEVAKIMFQTEEQDETPKHQLSEVEKGSSLPKKECRVMTVKIMQDLRERWMHRVRSHKKFLTELENMKTSQTEL